MGFNDEGTHCHLQPRRLLRQALPEGGVMSESLPPLILLAVSLCITPGPNNMMLTASGAAFGFRRTLPHALGITIGMLGLFILSALGLGVIFQRYPRLQQAFQIVSCTYLLYLAGRIALAKRSSEEGAHSRPLSVLEAAAFQLVNPKAYIITLSAVSTFAAPGIEYVASIIRILTVFAIVCPSCILPWAGFGALINRFLKSDRAFRTCNLILGSLTAASVIQLL
ncbi:MAG: LysE family translocator [Planctomycetota bacterium]|jgi:threonine/homoserine/homoserine lactone efflux protein